MIALGPQKDLSTQHLIKREELLSSVLGEEITLQISNLMERLIFIWGKLVGNHPQCSVLSNSILFDFSKKLFSSLNY